MNKKVLLTTVALSIIIAWWAYAMNGTGQVQNQQWWWMMEKFWKHGWCFMKGHHKWIMKNDEMFKERFKDAPDNIKAIITKKQSGQTLTDQDKTTMKDYMKKQWLEMMAERFKDAPDNIKAIIAKKQSGQTLTDQDKTTMKDYMEKQWWMRHKRGKNRPGNKWFNRQNLNTYKNVIEKKYWDKLNKMSEEELKNMQTKIKNLFTQIKDSNTYTEEKKRSYSEILWALNMIVQEKLTANNSSIDIINSLFNK